MMEWHVPTICAAAGFGAARLHNRKGGGGVRWGGGLLQGGGVGGAPGTSLHFKGPVRPQGCGNGLQRTAISPGRQLVRLEAQQRLRLRRLAYRGCAHGFGCKGFLQLSDLKK